MLTRREVMTGVLLSLGAPPAAGAQGTAVRIGVLGPPEEPRFSEIVSGLKQGLREQGYGEEIVHVVEARTPRGDDAGVRAAVQALVGQRIAVVFVVGSALARSVRDIAPTIPVVFVTPGDPVAAGLVASLARPGGNMTAMTFEYPELSGKRLELLRELAPRVRRVLALYDARDASPRQGLAAARAAAAGLGMTLVEREVSDAADIPRGLKALDEVDALLGIPGGATSGHHETMIAEANARRLPSVFYTRTASTRDALLTYGASDVDVAREAARMVARILKGAKPGDLPVERPTRLRLVVNVRTARALGLPISQSLLLRADQVIE